MRLSKIFIVFTFLLAFAVCVSAQSVQFPNELKSYEFFGKGKLKSLKLGISTKEEVKNIFGENCVESCYYNSNWEISFDYLKADSCFTSQTDLEPKQTFCPDEKYVGKLSSVELRPKKVISFIKTSFSNFGGYGGGSSIAEDGKGNGTHTSHNSFSDNYGLSYKIFDRVVSSTESNPTVFKKGDLLSIEYKISGKLNKKIFIKQ